MLGVIDLAYFGVTPEGVAAEVEDLVDDARSANPDVDVVVGEISQTWFPGVPEPTPCCPASSRRSTGPGPGWSWRAWTRPTPATSPTTARTRTPRARS